MSFVIALVTSKGGAGKTTAAAAITSELERRGRRVAIVDGDPNGHFTRWHRLNVEANPGSSRPSYGGLTDANILEVIDQARGAREWVVFDNEGVATQKTTFLFGRASLVVIPMKFSELDLAETRRTIAAINRTSELVGRAIPHAVLLSQTDPLPTNIERHIAEELRAAEVPIIKRRLASRVVWREVMNHGRSDLASFGTKGARDALADIAAVVGEIDTLVGYTEDHHG